MPIFINFLFIYLLSWLVKFMTYTSSFNIMGLKEKRNIFIWGSCLTSEVNKTSDFIIYIFSLTFLKPQKIVISGKLANYFIVLKSMCFFFKQFTNRDLPYKKVLLNFGTLDRVQSNLITVNTPTMNLCLQGIHSHSQLYIINLKEI